MTNSNDNNEFRLFPGCSGQVEPPASLEHIIETTRERYIEPILIKVDLEPTSLQQTSTDESTIHEENIELQNEEIKTPISYRIGRFASQNYYALQYRISTRTKLQKQVFIKDTITKHKILAPLSFAGILLVGGLTVNTISALGETDEGETFSDVSLENVSPTTNSVNRTLDTLVKMPSTGVTIPDTTTDTISPTSTSIPVETTTSTVAQETIASTEEPVTITETFPVETSLNSVAVDIYASLDCEIASAEVERGWTLSEIAEKCGVSLNTLKSYNPQITDYNNIITGTRINLIKPISSANNSTTTITESAPKVECVAIGGTVRPLQSGFTVEGYLKSLGYSNSQALFLAYSTSLLSDYGLSGELIAGNNYCYPTTNGIQIRYGVELG